MQTTPAPAPTPNGRPAEAHQMLGRRLRRLREAHGWKVETAARQLGWSAAKLSRLECGETSIKEQDMFQLLDLLQVVDTESRDAVLRLLRALNNPQWWHDVKTVLGGWFNSYLTLESVSQTIRTYEVRFIPGLLQTAAYAEAVIGRRYHDPAEVRRRVTIRMRRQQAVLDGGTALWAVIDHAALDESFAGTAVMRDQIAFLIEAARRRNVTIQILPPSGGIAAGIGTSFSLLRLHGEGFPDIVYLEHIDNALFLADATESDNFRSAMDELAVGACRPKSTEAVLAGALSLLEHRGR
jgi:transcriptional regulator with XRE-family HTH domain